MALTRRNSLSWAAAAFGLALCGGCMIRFPLIPSLSPHQRELVNATHFHAVVSVQAGEKARDSSDAAELASLLTETGMFDGVVLGPDLKAALVATSPSAGRFEKPLIPWAQVISMGLAPARPRQSWFIGFALTSPAKASAEPIRIHWYYERRNFYGWRPFAGTSVNAMSGDVDQRSARIDQLRWALAANADRIQASISR